MSSTLTRRILLPLFVLAVIVGSLLWLALHQHRTAPALAARPVLAASDAGATPANPGDGQSDPALQPVVLFKNPKPVPALSVGTLDGSAHLDLTAYRGKVVLLNFWATWCGPCRQEIPEFEKLQRQYSGKLQVIGMSVDELPPAAVAQVASRLGINYPVGMASDEIQKRFGGMPEIPVTFVIDPTGQVVQKNRGANDYAVFENEVRALLNLPITVKVVRYDQLSPFGKVGTIDIPGISAQLKELSPVQRQQALERLNAESCTCGCDMSVASCRVQDPTCSVSLPAATRIIAAIKAAK